MNSTIDLFLGDKSFEISFSELRLEEDLIGNHFLLKRNEPIFEESLIV
jgi:hypothetical protein